MRAGVGLLAKALGADPKYNYAKQYVWTIVVRQLQPQAV